MNIDAIKRNAVRRALELELRAQFGTIAQVAKDNEERPLRRISEIRSLLNSAEQLITELEKQ